VKRTFIVHRLKQSLSWSAKSEKAMTTGDCECFAQGGKFKHDGDNMQEAVSESESTKRFAL